VRTSRPVFLGSFRRVVARPSSLSLDILFIFFDLRPSLLFFVGSSSLSLSLLFILPFCFKKEITRSIYIYVIVVLGVLGLMSFIIIIIVLVTVVSCFFRRPGVLNVGLF